MYLDYTLPVVQPPSSLLLHRRKWLLPRLLGSRISPLFDQISLFPPPLPHQQRSPCSWSALLLAKLLPALLPSSLPSCRRLNAIIRLPHILPRRRRRMLSTQQTKQSERPDLPFDRVIRTIPNHHLLSPTTPHLNQAQLLPLSPRRRSPLSGPRRIARNPYIHWD